MSPREAASGTSSTSKPSDLAFSTDDESGRRPTTTSDARVLEVLRVGVALGAVAQDGDGLAVEQGEISVVVVEHAAEPSDQASATATQVRAGSVIEPSSAVFGATCSPMERLMSSIVSRSTAGQRGLHARPDICDWTSQ